MNRPRGFTLLELVMIIVLLGIVSTFVAVRSGSDFTAMGDAEELVQAIRYTQERAMHHTGNGSYQVTLSTTGYSFRPTASAISADSLDGVLQGSSINPTGSIQFNGRGLPTCSGGLICAGSTQNILVSSNGDTVTLTLQPYTGYVRR